MPHTDSSIRPDIDPEELYLDHIHKQDGSGLCIDDYLEDKVFAVYDDNDVAIQVVRYEDVIKLVRMYFKDSVSTKAVRSKTQGGTIDLKK